MLQFRSGREAAFSLPEIDALNVGSVTSHDRGRDSLDDMRLSPVPPPLSGTRSGFTLIEVLFAVSIFTVGALGLAAASATIIRQMALNAQRGNAASVAGARAERFHAGRCGGFGTFTEWTGGLRSEWSSIEGSGSAELDHRIRRSTPFGFREDRFMSGVSCQ